MKNKLYLGQDGFYDLIDESMSHKITSNNYNTCRSQFVTTIHESSEHIYEIVRDIDNGIFYSVEKKRRKKGGYKDEKANLYINDRR